MSKHITPACMYNFPSGASFHPCRLIQRDGTLMWKHALLYHGELNLPQSEAHEQHIIKTAQRLEELNSWVSRDLEPWNGLQVIAWYAPHIEELSEGIGVYFKPAQYETSEILATLPPLFQRFPTLLASDRSSHLKRCRNRLHGRFILITILLDVTATNALSLRLARGHPYATVDLVT